eukprot:scaffold290394_cov10-Tisochrysis_lutea.AAC.1
MGSLYLQKKTCVGEQQGRHAASAEQGAAGKALMSEEECRIGVNIVILQFRQRLSLFSQQTCWGKHQKWDKCEFQQTH